MSAFRTRLRAVAIVWLLCQAASLSAFVPEDCCAAHAVKTVEAKSAACHETPEAPAPEPKTGDVCPMHHGKLPVDSTQGSSAPSHECCVMTNGCAGPNVPLAHLFSFVGVLSEPPVSFASPGSSPVLVEPPASPLARLVRPDAPPPKA